MLQGSLFRVFGKAANPIRDEEPGRRLMKQHDGIVEETDVTREALRQIQLCPEDGKRIEQHLNEQLLPVKVQDNGDPCVLASTPVSVTYTATNVATKHIGIEQRTLHTVVRSKHPEIPLIIAAS